MNRQVEKWRLGDVVTKTTVGPWNSYTRRGVVVMVYTENQSSIFFGPGDAKIQERSPGMSVVSNDPTSWTHVPHEEYETWERVLSIAHSWEPPVEDPDHWHWFDTYHGALVGALTEDGSPHHSWGSHSDIAGEFLEVAHRIDKLIANQKDY